MRDRGTIAGPAKHLVAGDKVMTKTGASSLVSVSREEFGGNVHNLKVGSEREAASLGDDQTVVYANGFLVGDGQIQSKYESLELAARRQIDVDKHLPARWRKDYENSARRNARLTP